MTSLPGALFLQAEAGRGAAVVTRVQTCAMTSETVVVASGRIVRPLFSVALGSTDLTIYPGGDAGAIEVATAGGLSFNDRSEERRVGKERRSRWSTYH